MAVPVISNIYPTFGPTAGGTSVRILGLGFGPQVEVEFAGRKSADVRFINDSLVYAVSPPSPVDPVTGGHGTVDILAQNLDSTGVPAAGEAFTFAGSFEYRMPDLAEQSQLTYVVEQLILEFRRQVLAETVMNQHSDYSNRTAPAGETSLQVPNEEQVTRVAKLPALILLGPSLTDNRVFQLFDVVQTNQNGEWTNQLAPTSVDLSFELIGVANKTQVLLNLMHAALEFFRRNRKLRVPCDPADPTAGFAEYDMEWEVGGFPQTRDHMNDSDVLTFIGTFLIRAVALDSLAGVNLPPGTDAVTDRGAPLADSVEVGPPAQHGTCTTTTFSKVV